MYGRTNRLTNRLTNHHSTNIETYLLTILPSPSPMTRAIASPTSKSKGKQIFSIDYRVAMSYKRWVLSQNNVHRNMYFFSFIWDMTHHFI